MGRREKVNGGEKGKVSQSEQYTQDMEDSIYRMQHFTYGSRVAGTEWQENEQELQIVYEETSITHQGFRLF